jgi:general secretion pathway protein F
MAMYRYRAIAADGGLVSGAMEASNEAIVVQRVRDLGHYPVSASLQGSRVWSDAFRSTVFRRSFSYRALAIACEELATLLQAGLDLDGALGILERLGDLGPLRESFAAARTRLRGGASFASALSADFPKFFVSMVMAGETGGTLAETLGQLSGYLSRSAAVRETVASALVYPIILLATAGLSVTFILVFVLPEFQPLFQEAGAALPWPTRAVIAVGDVLRGYWWAIAAVAVAIALVIRRVLRSPVWRLTFDRQSLRLPVFGKLLAAIDVERFSRTLGTLLTNGVTLPAALPIAREVIANRAMAAAVQESAVGLREGDGLASRLARTGLFPAVTVDLVKVGEETGKLDDMLLRQADLDEQRIRHAISRLLAVLVPALTVLLGLVVGGLIASLLTAILSINDLALPR